VAGADAVAASLAQSAIAAVLGNGFAEHWDPERGTGLGAVPQTWSTLAAVMATE
jgi:GH15 family glucan-1,4-alpha-glucosidase